MAIYSRTVNAQEKLCQRPRDALPLVQGRRRGHPQIFEEYTRRKRENNVLDYDDLLLFWKVLCKVPGTGDTVADRFEHILVDEYQDTNALQAADPAGHAQDTTRTSWWSATMPSRSTRSGPPRSATSSTSPSSSPARRVVTLEQNYRSIEPILDRLQRGDGAGRGAVHQESLVEARPQARSRS